MSASSSKLPLVLSLLALGLSGGFIAQSFSFQNTINSLNDKLTSVNGRVDIVQAPKVQNLTVTLAMGGITNTSGTSDSLATLENHRWDPSVLVVHKGDTVNLRIVNDDDHIHSLVMIDYAINSGRLAAGQSVTKTFVADKAGVFLFECGIPYTPPNDCAPDHLTVDGTPSITGYLVVIAA